MAVPELLLGRLETCNAGLAVVSSVGRRTDAITVAVKLGTGTWVAFDRCRGQPLRLRLDAVSGVKARQNIDQFRLTDETSAGRAAQVVAHSFFGIGVRPCEVEVRAQ
jgi:hypothetical protein